MRTLDTRKRNRGLFFDVEMLRFCGQRFVVRSRADRIVDDKTGRLLLIGNPSVILEGTACSGCISRGRLFCPRGIYPLWREVWLKRVAETSSGQREQS